MDSIRRKSVRHPIPGNLSNHGSNVGSGLKAAAPAQFSINEDKREDEEQM